MERSLSAVRTIRAALAEEREAGMIEDVAHRAFLAGSRVARLVSVTQPVMSLAQVRRLPVAHPLPPTQLLVPLPHRLEYWPPAPSVMDASPLSFQKEKK